MYGSRFLAGRPRAPWLTIVANRVLTTVTNVLFWSRITDMETCYKIMRTDVARSLALESEPLRHRAGDHGEAAAGRASASWSCPIVFQPRNYDEGKKIGWRDGVRALRVLVGYRFSGWRPSPAHDATA